MISFLKGTVAAVTETEVVLENNGVGFAVQCPSGTIAACRVGQETQLFTFLQVREDALVLFGFSDNRQKELFLQLTGVTGIGCRTACGILSGVSTCDLAMAIAAGDARALSGVKGVGKKTAERIILELREKVSKLAIVSENSTASRDVRDAIAALAALGLTQTEATEAVMNVPNVANLELNAIVAAALKGLRT